MKTIFLFAAGLLGMLHSQAQPAAPVVDITRGQMPNLALDASGNVLVAFGRKDSLYVMQSSDGSHFSEPELISVVPKMFSHAMRGPQIARVYDGWIIAACTEDGQIVSFRKSAKGAWERTGQLNEKGSAPEGLMSLSADGRNAFAVWLNVKKPRGQELFGARSSDGGKTWTRERIYSSPDSTICECCKPNVAMKGNTVYVMFRNWLNKSRDMYVMKSTDAGRHFAAPQKQGTGTWPLNGCPMDGGGITIDDKGDPVTVWRRESTVFSSTPASAETMIGPGKNASVAVVNGRAAYAWSEKGNLVWMLPGETKQVLGKGMLPQLKALPNNRLLCIWEEEGQLKSSIAALK